MLNSIGFHSSSILFFPPPKQTSSFLIKQTRSLVNIVSMENVEPQISLSRREISSAENNRGAWFIRGRRPCRNKRHRSAKYPIYRNAYHCARLDLMSAPRASVTEVGGNTRVATREQHAEREEGGGGRGGEEERKGGDNGDLGSDTELSATLRVPFLPDS